MKSVSFYSLKIKCILVPFSPLLQPRCPLEFMNNLFSSFIHKITCKNKTGILNLYLREEDLRVLPHSYTGLEILCGLLPQPAMAFFKIPVAIFIHFCTFAGKSPNNIKTVRLFKLLQNPSCGVSDTKLCSVSRQRETMLKMLCQQDYLVHLKQQ